MQERGSERDSTGNRQEQMEIKNASSYLKKEEKQGINSPRFRLASKRRQIYDP
jgi:hypothetical protein